MQHVGRKQSPAHTGLWPFGQTVTCCPGLLFNDLHARNPCDYFDYYSFTDS